MGLSCERNSGCDEWCAWRDPCVCASDNVSRRNGYSNSSSFHHTPFEYSYSSNDIDNGAMADKEERLPSLKSGKRKCPD